MNSTSRSLLIMGACLAFVVTIGFALGFTVWNFRPWSWWVGLALVAWIVWAINASLARDFEGVEVRW